MSAPRGTGALLVSEIFGPTLQGEGPSLGRQATFLRLGVCNLSCHWCDTPYTWDRTRFNLSQQMRQWPAQEVLDAVHATGAPSVLVVTGGEPMLQQSTSGFRTVMRVLRGEGWAIEVETNGTKPPTGETDLYVRQYNVSPKLAHAGDPHEKRIVLPALKALKATKKAVFKFVCRTVADLAEVQEVVAAAGLSNRDVWIMPEGTSAPDIVARTRQLADPVIAAGYNMTTRLHILAWGDRRGV